MTRMGRQTPTQSVILPYTETKGFEAVELYNSTGRTALQWQELLACDIMAVNEEGLWIHQKFGYSVPRRNGKNEVVTMREMWGLENGEKICHTAHRTTTSHSSWERLCKLLQSAGYVELGRKKKGEVLPEKGYRTSKQYGLESITIEGKGMVVFRTRTDSGGLGEGFDLLIIDEAQEYTDKQESALIYTVSDSNNPQTIYCGTPPTSTSSGTVFVKMRNDALHGDVYDTGWAEWSISEQADDVHDVDLWYETNPSMGAHLNERKVRSEIRGDIIDFNIQRLGLWIQYNQKSAISDVEWEALKLQDLPKFKGNLFVGIKYGIDNTHVAMAIAVKTDKGKIFVEAIDCRPFREGNDWILQFLLATQPEKIVIDGKSGQDILKNDMKDARIRKIPILPTVKEVIQANSSFIQALEAQSICHMGQPSLVQSVTNCEKRNIGTGGGFGFKAQKEGIEIALLDSIILARWICAETKIKQKQNISY